MRSNLASQQLLDPKEVQISQNHLPKLGMRVVYFRNTAHHRESFHNLATFPTSQPLRGQENIFLNSKLAKWKQ